MSPATRSTPPSRSAARRNTTRKPAPCSSACRRSGCRARRHARCCSRLNSVLAPLGSYIAKNLTDVIPVKHIKAEKRGEAWFLATVKSVRVDGNAVALDVHGYHIATAAIALMLAAILSAVWLIVSLLHFGTSFPPQENTAVTQPHE